MSKRHINLSIGAFLTIALFIGVQFAQACGGGPMVLPSHLALGMLAQVISPAGSNPATPLNIRDDVSTSSVILDRVKTGDQVIVLGGPLYGDIYVWWQVKTPSNIIGWAAEASPDDYYLQPMGSGPIKINTKPIPAAVVDCPDAPETRLNTGMQGAVITHGESGDATPTRIRDQAGKDGKQVGQLLTGDLFNVVDGPKCLDSYVWWKVKRIGDNLSGWVAEGDNDSYYINPLGQSDGGYYATNDNPKPAPSTLMFNLTETAATAISSTVFSPDGKSILTGSTDKIAQLWDAKTGKQILTFTGHTDSVNAVAFSPDGKQILTGSADKTARLWDATTGTEIREFTGHTDAILSVAFAPDGKTIATGSADQSARTWDVASGKELKQFLGHRSPIHSIAFSPDGKYILTGGGDSTGNAANDARLWDATTADLIQTYAGHTGPVMSVNFSPDGKHVVTGSTDKSVRVWGRQSGSKLITYDSTSAVNSVAFSSDGRYLMAGNADASTLIWDVQTAYEVYILNGSYHSVLSAAFAPDVSAVVTVGDNNMAYVWSLLAK